jgi:hypothetical protein
MPPPTKSYTHTVKTNTDRCCNGNAKIVVASLALYAGAAHKAFY